MCALGNCILFLLGLPIPYIINNALLEIVLIAKLSRNIGQEKHHQSMRNVDKQHELSLMPNLI